ncbi:MAG: amidohydrolase [Clostridia bacterium]
MKIRFYNARILTMETLNIISGEVWVNNDKIILVGAPKNENHIWDREIDCKNNLLMPSFKNGHSHSPMTYLRSLADDVPLQDWLYKKVFPFEAKATGQDVYWGTVLAIMEYLTSGISATFDMYFFERDCIQAFLDTGFRGVFCSGYNSITSSTETVYNQLLTEYDLWNTLSPLVSYQIGFHAEYTTPRPMLEEICKAIHTLKAPSYTHLSEGRGEREDCIKRNGLSPTEYLSSLGFWDYGGGAFHSIHLSDDEIDILKSKNVGVITNSACNAKIASGIAPLTKYLAKGVNVGLGTDGPASNNSLDFFKEMFTCSILQKVETWDASQLDANDVLKMATVGSAKVMRLDNCDTLSVGKQADIILINMNEPNMQPENNIPKNIVYAGSKKNIMMTMVAGKILYENGNFNIGISPEVVYRELNKTTKRILA